MTMLEVDEEWQPPTPTLVIRDALQHLHLALLRLENLDQTPKPLRFQAMSHLAIAETILHEYLEDWSK